MDDIPQNTPLFVFKPPEPVDVEIEESEEGSSAEETMFLDSIATQSDEGCTTEMHFHSDFVAAKRFFGVCDNDSHKSVEEEVDCDQAAAAFEGSSLLHQKMSHPSKEELRTNRRERLSQLELFKGV
eukprot:CAMPEP_0195290242 /NCGR_PEP_ID=MMETSP0707-20130614/6184_1 /TAXON_ID=33640 /ORGANISM="Asterionellopsis glacialis, Strain CCMP134" /LENGTH=125 /DNA_ID=CAMNT_0040350343 /DNA_START=90 /DNA_END=468 /DNA_ORIENTATION=+